MSERKSEEHANMRQARVISLVIAGTMVLWMGGQWIGGQLGLPSRYVFLLDLFALAGFLWALIVTWQLWRKNRSDPGSR